MGYILYQAVGETVELVMERVVVEDFVVDIVDGNRDGNSLAAEVFVEFWFVGAVAFAGEPFDAVAVHSVVEFLLGSGYEHLCRHPGRKGIGRTGHPMHTIGKHHKTMPRLEQGVNELLAAQPFLFAKGVHG